LTSYIATGLSSSNPAVGIKGNFNGPSLVQAVLDRWGYDQRIVSEVKFALLLYNFTAISQVSGALKYKTPFELIKSTNPANSSLFNQQPTNFGIPSSFATDKGFDKNCIVGIFSLLLSNNNSPTIYVGITTNPIIA
jgi:hypothetical protein